MLLEVRTNEQVTLMGLLCDPHLMFFSVEMFNNKATVMYP